MADNTHGPRGYFTGFNPAIGGKAKKAKGEQTRDWHLNRRSSADLSILTFPRGWCPSRWPGGGRHGAPVLIPPEIG